MMIDTEDFDDVDINNISHTHRSHSSKGPYGAKVVRPGTASLDTINRSSTSLLHTTRDKNITTSPVHHKMSASTPDHSPQKQQKSPQKPLPARPSYSPSKKLKLLRERKEPLDFSQLDNSDDELDESTIIYDVPLSQSLVQLAQNQKLVTPKLMSIASDSTRHSSLMSYDHSTNDANSDYELDILHDEALKLTCEFAQSKAVLASQQSAMRRHILSQLEKPQGIDQEDISQSGLKQKYVTNTRPTHLPPKDRTESLRHSREVEQMKERAIKEEIKQEKLRLKEIERREQIKLADLHTWEHVIIPDFNEQIKMSTTRELWWRGVPTKLREYIWTELLKQKSIKPGLLQSLRSRSRSLIRDNSSTVQKIKKDIKNVFPDLSSFQEGDALHNDLVFLLTMFAQHNKYDPALASLAAVLLFNIHSVDDSFRCLCGLLNRPLMKMLYSDSMERFNKESQSFLRTFHKRNARLAAHFDHVGIEPETYLVPLLKPLFANLLSMENASSILDVYIFEGDAFLWRCVLGLFEKIEYKLYGNEDEIMDVIGWNASMKLNGGKVGTWWKYLDVGDDIEFLDTIRLSLKKAPVA